MSGGNDGSFKIKPPRPGYFFGGALRGWPGRNFGIELSAERWKLLEVENEPVTGQLSLAGHVLFGDPTAPWSIGGEYSDFDDARMISILVGRGF